MTGDTGARTIVATREGAVTTIELARPERRNALNLDTLSRLHELLASAVAGRDRVVVLCGRGQSFCAGFDVKDGGETGSAGAARRFALLLQDTTRLLRSPDVLSIAVVQGHAIGAGWELAMATDYVVAASGSRFALPEVRLGLAVGGGITSALTMAVGELRAKNLTLFGRNISAEEALELGLVSEVVPQDGMTERLRVLTEEALALPDVALRHAKQLFKHLTPSEGLMQAEAEAMASTVMNDR